MDELRHDGRKGGDLALEFALWLLAASPSEADLGDRIAVRGSVDCLRADRLAARVGAWLDGRVPDEVEVSVVHEPEHLLVRLSTADGEAVREFIPPPTTCADTETAVAAFISVAIDTAAIEATHAPTATAEAPTRPPARAMPVDSSPRQSESMAGPPSLHGAPFVGAAIGSSGAVLPRPALEAALEVGASWSWVMLRAGFEGGFAWGIELGPAPGTLRVARVGPRALACPQLQRGRVGMAICAGLAGGPWIARAHRIAAPRTGVTGWLAVLAGFELRVRVAPRIELVGEGQLVVSPIRPQAVAEDAASGASIARETPLLGARGLLGVRVHPGLRRGAARSP